MKKDNELTKYAKQWGLDWEIAEGRNPGEPVAFHLVKENGRDVIPMVIGESREHAENTITLAAQTKPKPRNFPPASKSNFEDLYQRAIKAAEHHDKYGLPRFYKQTQSDSVSYALAIGASKNLKSLKAYVVVHYNDKKKPDKAVMKSIILARTGERAGYHTLDPKSLPENVMEQFRERV